MVDGDPVATGLCVSVRVSDNRVLDESGQRMRGLEFGRDEPRESGHVAKGAVEFERFRASEIGFDVSQYLHLYAGVEMLAY